MRRYALRDDQWDRIKEDARRQIGAFIEDVYNAKRLHSSLGYKPRLSSKPSFAGTTPTKQPRTRPCHELVVSQWMGAVHHRP